MHPPSSTSNDITLILLYLVTTWLLWQLGVSLVVAGVSCWNKVGFDIFCACYFIISRPHRSPLPPYWRRYVTLTHCFLYLSFKQFRSDVDVGVSCWWIG